MRKFILPYRKGSNTVRNLATELDLLGIRYEGSKYKSREKDFVINWGNSNPTVDLSQANVLNDPDRVGFVSNKRNFFEMMSNHDIPNPPRLPPWTLDKAEVLHWLGDGKVVFARTKLTGNSGEGIDILEGETDLSDYPTNTLFVKYVKKKEEYRVHFFKGEIFDIQRKGLRTDYEGEPNFRVRNHKNGFVFVRNDVGIVPEDVTTQVENTIHHLGLDFGAVDVIYNKLHNEAFILEVNSAPGLEGTTLRKYVEKFSEELENHVNEKTETI